jgi:hypothetical protein
MSKRTEYTIASVVAFGTATFGLIHTILPNIGTNYLNFILVLVTIWLYIFSVIFLCVRETKRINEKVDTLSDEQLIAVIHRPFAWPLDARLRELTALGRQGALTDAEQSEMEGLIRAWDQYVLMRSKALLLLKQRGRDVLLV